MPQVSGCTCTPNMEWVTDSGHAQTTCVEPVGGSVAFPSKPSLNSVTTASAYDSPIVDPPCCNSTAVARNGVTSTGQRLMFGGSASFPFECNSTVPPTRLPHAPTSTPAKSADAQPQMVPQQRAGQVRIHDVPPAVDSAKEKVHLPVLTSVG